MTNTNKRAGWMKSDEEIKQMLFLLATRKQSPIARLAHDRMVHAEIAAAEKELFG